MVLLENMEWESHCQAKVTSLCIIGHRGSRDIQNNTGYLNCPWLSTITTWWSRIVEWKHTALPGGTLLMKTQLTLEAQHKKINFKLSRENSSWCLAYIVQEGAIITCFWKRKDIRHQWSFQGWTLKVTIPTCMSRCDYFVIVLLKF